ncbi:hypothetical protein AHAS_Ahas20G0017200 [Arachis hypogaea]
MYAEVGKELCLCKDFLYISSTNVATCTYLHLVDGFVNSPQRDFSSGNSHHHHHKLLVLN